MRRKFFLASVLSMVVAGAHAGEWVNLGTTSNTVADHICDVVISPGGYPDIDCPETNPEITASGVISATGISVTGAISTTILFVNGTEITGGGGGGGASVPKYTTTQRDNLTPAQGDVIYNLTEDRIEWYDGKFWTAYSASTDLVSSLSCSSDPNWNDVVLYLDAEMASQYGII